MLVAREHRKLQLKQSDHLPDFDPKTANIRESSWVVSPVPRRLQCRHVDLGDVSPSNTPHFIAALKSTAQGIQVKSHSCVAVYVCLKHKCINILIHVLFVCSVNSCYHRMCNMMKDCIDKH